MTRWIGSMLAWTIVLCLAPAPAAWAQSEVVLGIPGPLSGPAAGYGQDIKAGAEIAMEEINAAGGIAGKRLRLVLRDDEAKPDRALSVVREMVERDGVRIIVGPAFSTAVLSTLDYLNGQKVLQIVNNATNDQIMARSLPYLFRVSTPDRFAARRMVQYAVQSLKATKIAVIGDTTGYGKGGTTAILAELKERSLTPVAIESYNWGDTDMRPQLARINQAGAKVLLGYGTVAEISHLVRQLDELRYGITFINGEATNTGNYTKLAGKASEGTLMVRTIPPFNPDYVAGHADAARFLEKLKAKVGRPVDAEQQHVTIYNVLYLVKRVVEGAGGSADPEALRKSMEALSEFRPPLGGNVWRFSPTDHQGLKPDQLRVIKIKDGLFTIVE